MYVRPGVDVKAGGCRFGVWVCACAKSVCRHEKLVYTGGKGQKVWPTRDPRRPEALLICHWSSSSRPFARDGSVMRGEHKAMGADDDDDSMSVNSFSPIVLQPSPVVS